MENMQYSLSKQEWMTFRDSYWQQRPVVLHSSQLLASPTQAFDEVIETCNEYRKRGGLNLKLLVYGTQLVQEIHKHLPQASDKTLAAYEARLQEELGAKTFAIYCGSFQKYSLLLYERVREFLDGLFDIVGIPAGHVELELFLGRYAFTPGGIHKEKCTNFQWVIDGHKTMLTWPEEAIDPEELSVNSQEEPVGQQEEAFLDNVNIEEYLQKALALEGDPGDILYWPSGYWHVGGSPSLSLCFTIALYMQGRPYELVNQVVSELVSAKLGEASLAEPYPFTQGTTTNIPDTLFQPVNILRQVVESPSLRTELTAQWLKRATGLAFNQVPERLPETALSDDQLVQRNPTIQITWSITGDDLIYAANGHSSLVDATPGLVDLLEQLNQGAVFSINQLFAQHGDVVTKEAIQTMLEDLYTMRAIIKSN